MTHPVPDGDVLIHCGDMTGRGRELEVIDVANWMGGMPHRHKMAIAGNHDGALERDTGYLRQVFSEYGILYLQDTAVDIRGVRFWGAPWTPNFCNWHFMPDRYGSELRAKWALIPDDTQVLITHGPPHGVLDYYIDPSYGMAHVGCELLAERIEQLPELRVHAFGHIHESQGKTVLVYDATGPMRQVDFINAAICDRNYDPVNAPQVVDL